MKKTVIVISNRQLGAQYNAWLKSHPRIWGCGDAVAEAIGNMVLCHLRFFHARLEDNRVTQKEYKEI